MEVSKIRVWLMLPALVRSLLVFPWALEASTGIQGHQDGPSPLPSDEFPVAPHPTATCVCVRVCVGVRKKRVKRWATCATLCVCARACVCALQLHRHVAAPKQEAEEGRT
ncbi:uncharacterized protein LY79DRAFT_547847 [Colletotrichum navitas]|uniref:Secreted protein n=1 Tax=Colletotrichum navitas TaxID=681940 RepID=A0AAD8Q3T6_9PEZI|nr:uncharacterized protein LY79DRAFT_547847 [Colletotrichum navitas]KAK1595029.1 hypothetical protein LY79DRAFT_547847 [Colletotrichum navitas]